MKIHSTLNWQKYSDRLIPSIVQDSVTGQVLMLGFMNKEALTKTIKTGSVTFFSRSKKRLWTKGETSGNTLRLVDILKDCDNDALLILAEPKGPTCHSGQKSCFGEKSELPLVTIGRLSVIINQRAASFKKGSYTRFLLTEGLEKCAFKIAEESGELIRAAQSEGRQRTTEESADLIYHIMVLLKQQNISFNDVCEELKKRMVA